MPKGTSLGIGLGIEAGARNFLDSYFAVKKHKDESKYRKLAPVMQILFDQMKDENIPLDQKIKAMDSLEPLLNIKSDEKLSRRLGLDKLIEQQIEVGEEKVAAQPDKLVEDQGAALLNQQNPEIATSITQKGTPATTKKLLRRRGDLSQADINLIQKKQLRSAELQDEFEKQYKLAQLNADLQARVLGQNGWIKGGSDWTYDPSNKTYQQEWFNPITKESYQQKLQPGVVPETVILKQIQASGSGGKGVSLAYKTLRQSIATTMGKEIDDPEVEMQTAKIWKNNFALGVINKQQDVEGTTPIQPNQKFDNSMQILQAQQKHGEFIAAAQASLDNVNSLGTRKSAAWQAAADAKSNFDKVKEDYEADEKEYQQAENNWQGATKTANDLESEYQNALKAHNKAQELVKQSEENLSKAGVGTNTSSQQSQFSSRMRIAIDAVRKANPTTKLTDAQIAERIRREKGIQ